MLKRLSGQNYFGNGLLYMPGEHYVQIMGIIRPKLARKCNNLSKTKKVKEEMKIEKNERMILKRKNDK